MPYIPSEHRGRLDAGDRPKSSGELNYSITKLLQLYWVNSNRRYQDLNDIVGALEGAKQEFYRIVVVPYEDKKMKENGGFYWGE